MKTSTLKSAQPKIINSPDYQEYLEFLEEEAMNKNPDDFCFQKPDLNTYSQSDFNAFSSMPIENDVKEYFIETEIQENYRVFSVAM